MPKTTTPPQATPAQTVHPRLTAVEARPGHVLAFTLRGERGQRVVDLAGMINRTAVLRPLLDGQLFAKVEVIDFGIAVGWGPESPDRPELSAETLQRMALYQAPMTGADFRAWRERLDLSLTETAEVLGIGLRTVHDHQAAAAVPAVVSIACRALEADPQLLLARFHPSAPAGRPRKLEGTGSQRQPVGGRIVGVYPLAAGWEIKLESGETVIVETQNEAIAEVKALLTKLTGEETRVLVAGMKGNSARASAPRRRQRA